MKKNIFKILMLGLILLASKTALAEDALQFTKATYETMQAIDPAKPTFADQALETFKNSFNFNEFSHRAMQDFEQKLTPAQAKKLTQLFEELFFSNFRKKADKIVQRRIENPTYSISNVSPALTEIHVSGKASIGDVTIAFFMQPQSDGNFKLIDLSVDSVLLSRNYRGAFNRTFREKGFAGLYERLSVTLEKLKTKS